LKFEKKLELKLTLMLDVPSILTFNVIDEESVER